MLYEKHIISNVICKMLKFMWSYVIENYKIYNVA